MLRRMLLAASDSDRTRQLIISAPVTRGIVARYVAGDTAEQALQVTRGLLNSGLLVTLDQLGEDTLDPDQAAARTAGISIAHPVSGPSRGTSLTVARRCAVRTRYIA